jgi:hypothetical protein
MNTPIPEDLLRDLTADLALCDAATPGPLRSQWGNTAPLPHKVWAEAGVIARFYSEADAVLFAAARACWSAAARRALAAEARVKALEAACGLLLDDVGRYVARGGTLTETEAAHVGQMLAAVEGRPAAK